MNLSVMRGVLAARGIQLTKSLGQNFLHDANQLWRIVQAAELSRADKVLEIGPGLGPLTELLLAEAGEVLAIEKDARLVEVLRERFKPLTLSPPPSHAELQPPTLDAPRGLEPAGELAQASSPPSSSGVPPGVRASSGTLPQLAAGPGCATQFREETAKTGVRTSEHSGFHLLQADALEFIRREPRDWREWKLVANLPYSVASPILVELAQSPRGPERMVVTLQLEVAQRLMADADDDDYGLLSLLVQLDYEPRDWFKIPASCFFPAPDVDSACVILMRRSQPLLAEEHRPAFVKTVKRAFSQRRKMMMKLLKADWPVEKLQRAFITLNIPPQTRAEKVSLEMFARLASLLDARTD